MELNEAIYKIRSKEKMIKADFSVGTGNTKEDLQELIDASLKTTKTELSKQVKDGYFTRKEANDIYGALAQMPILDTLPTGEAVATYPEFRANELYIRSVAIRLDTK